MKQIFKIFDYVFVLRPTLFFAVWTGFLAGFFSQAKFGTAATAMANNSALNDGKEFMWVGGFLTLLMGAVFILNQIMDRQSDNKNKKLFLIAQGHISPRAALFESAILILVALAFGFFFSVEIGLLFLALLVITGLFYSFSPFSWKDKPLLGFLTNVAGALLIYGGGWLIRGGLNQDLIIYAIPYVCSVGAVYLLTTIPDVEGDAAAEKITFGVKYGTMATVYFGVALDFAALIISYNLNDEIIFYPALFSLPFFIWAAFYPELPEIVRAIKYSVLFLACAICVKWIVTYPQAAFSFKYAFLIALAGVYFLSKIYYRLRFGINYPNLSA